MEFLRTGWFIIAKRLKYIVADDLLNQKIMAANPGTRDRAIEHRNQRPVHAGTAMISAGEPFAARGTGTGDD